jgi:plasmid stabilization system protein ParE
MSFRVAIARKAAREIAQQYDWIAEQASPAAADRWRDSLVAAINSLEEDPEHCPQAPEAEWYGEELRQLLHGRRRRVNRILFEIRGDTVVVLRVRHSAQDFLRPEEL